MRNPLPIAAAAFLMAALPIHSQERRAGDSASYRVKFTIRDNSDPTGKAVRTYSLITAPNRKATFRAGDRVPLAAVSFQSGPSAAASAVNTQYNYIDTGVNIECIVAEAGGKLSMHGILDLSTVDRHDAKPGAANPNPTIGQTRLELDTAVDPGKPAIVASIDDPVNMRKLEVEATVTRID